MIPGEVLTEAGEIELNAGRDTRTLTVANTGDRPVQVGSHAHFYEANKYLEFDRASAYGFRLDVPSGTALRFEPGEKREIALVAVGGSRTMYGMNALVAGGLDEKADHAAAALETFLAKGESE